MSFPEVLNRCKITYKVPIPIYLEDEGQYQELIEEWNINNFKPDQQAYWLENGMILSF